MVTLVAEKLAEFFKNETRTFHLQMNNASTRLSLVPKTIALVLLPLSLSISLSVEPSDAIPNKSLTVFLLCHFRVEFEPTLRSVLERSRAISTLRWTSCLRSRYSFLSLQYACQLLYCILPALCCLAQTATAVLYQCCWCHPCGLRTLFPGRVLYDETELG